MQAHDATEPYDIVFMDWRMPGMDGLQASRHIKSDETLTHRPAIVLVTAFGREEVREEAERLQLDGFLQKPVTKSMIVDTLVNVFADGSEDLRVVAGVEQASRLHGARILLAEDNEINQQIAVELLEGAGATVVVANHGREAVEMLSGPGRPHFDVVLMDLQMPEMDGYQATAKLRADARLAALPIVAMTAHATVEERQRCLAAGMNDHVAKPIDPAALFEAVGRFYRSAEGAPDQPSSPAPQEALPPIAGVDMKDGLARVGGNRTLYVKILRQFAEQQGPAPDQIAAALAKGDHALAERLAHTLKGVAGNIGAAGVQSAAAALERAIRDRSNVNEMERARTGCPGCARTARDGHPRGTRCDCVRRVSARSTGVASESGPVPRGGGAAHLAVVRFGSGGRRVHRGQSRRPQSAVRRFGLGGIRNARSGLCICRREATIGSRPLNL